jgi:methylmalonyl-CoA/ethylmalonyl-CoA epimerase
VTIEIRHVDHIAMAVADEERQSAILEGLFGFRRRDTYEYPHQGFIGISFDVPGSSGVGWEVMAPRGENSFLHRFLEGAQGPGLHHVAFQIDDLDAAMAELRSHDIEPFGTETAEEHNGRAVTFLHPRRGGQGLLIQLFTGPAWNDAEQMRAARWDPGHPTLGIVELHHLSHASPDREQLVGWYERLFGFRTIFRGPREPDRAYDTAVLDLPTGEMHWELIAPRGEGSFIQRFLDERGPGPHHVTFLVEDWERALAACRHHGVHAFGEDEGTVDGARYREAFLHPGDTGGMLVQFVWEERPGSWL